MIIIEILQFIIVFMVVVGIFQFVIDHVIVFDFNYKSKVFILAFVLIILNKLVMMNILLLMHY